VALLDGDQIAQAAVTQGIADQMAPRTHVNFGHGGGAGVARNDRAPGDLAGEERRFRTVQRGADLGMKPVRADQKRGLNPLAAFQNHHRAEAAKINLGDAGQQTHRNPGLGRAFEQQIDKVGAVQEVIALPRPEPRQIKPRHRIARRAVDQLNRVSPDRSHVKRILKPKRAQDRSPVGRDLQSGPDLADLVGLFKH
jgi:hypothetical protein